MKGVEVSIIFYSDPHFGLARTTHTTPASRDRLKAEIVAAVAKVYEYSKEKGSPVICLGDFFDTENVSNADMVQAGPFWESALMVLQGNHDSTNRDSSRSSYEVFNALKRRGASDPLCLQDCFLYSVPHCPTQEAFMAALDQAEESGRQAGDPAEYEIESKLLLLHCNYASPFDLNESSLNLTRERAQALLEVYDRILIGHEHTARTDLDGKVVLLGSVFPTGFDNLTDKYFWEYLPEFDELQQIPLWQAKASVVRCPWETPDVEEGAQFVEFTGAASAQDLPKISAMIANLWRACPSLLMVKNSADVESTLPEFKTQEASTLSIPDAISKALQGTDLEELWNHYKAQHE